MLMRIRIPGGLFSADQLGAVAEASAAFADGQIEITSRANVQLRGIEAQDLPKMIDALAATGLMPSATHDRARNIVTSPLAGLDPNESFDPRPLLRELDRRLITDAGFSELHPKFSFAIDGGGKWFSRETDDLALRAWGDRTAPMLQLFIAGLDTGFAVATVDAVACFLEAARACLRLATRFDVAARAKKIMAIPAACEEALQAVSHFLVPSPSREIRQATGEVPLGLYREREADRVSVIPCVALGRLTFEQAKRIAAVAVECEADLRLAPWRGVVLGAVAKRLAVGAVAGLEAVGLRCDGRDGFHGIAACAGSMGCDASLADVRADAAALAKHFSATGSNPGWTVNFSGCEKQCAMRQGADAALVATLEGYNLRIDGQLSTFIHSPESALQAILSARSGREIVSEVIR